MKPVPELSSAPARARRGMETSDAVMIAIP